jgi:hypothetical protein
MVKFENFESIIGTHAQQQQQQSPQQQQPGGFN